MKFTDILKTITKTEERPLSRLYGYDRSGDGKATIVDPEARVVATVIIALATDTDASIEEILDGILQQFAEEGVRNRSGKRWTRSTLLGLVRPIYGGFAVSPRGVWRQSKLYPPIVAPERLKAAIRRLKTAKVAY
jgi:hypothetical protein